MEEVATEGPVMIETILLWYDVSWWHKIVVVIGACYGCLVAINLFFLPFIVSSLEKKIYALELDQKYGKRT